MRLKEKISDLRRTTFEMLGSPRYSRPALNDLDRKLSRYLNMRDGYFIEAGANDGYSQSNTYYLEKFRGWHGMLIEGVPELYQKCRRRRKQSTVINCALVPFDQEGRNVEMTFCNLMSLVSGALGDSENEKRHLEQGQNCQRNVMPYRLSVIGRSLTSLLNERGVSNIDFFSLDVEGFEEQVLNGLDFSVHRPKYICVEARKKEAIFKKLEHHYEMVEQLSPMDFLFRTKG